MIRSTGVFLLFAIPVIMIFPLVDFATKHQAEIAQLLQAVGLK